MITLARFPTWSIYLAVALAALVCFGAAVRAPFHFDDKALLVDPAITSPEGWRGVWRWEQSRPLTWFSFWANYWAHGPWPAGFHAVNLALHAMSSMLVLACLRRVIPFQCAWIAAGIFAMHPIQTEAVVYVFARSTLLMTALCLVSLWFWLRGQHWIAAAWFGLALLAKEECAAFPVFLAMLHISISRNRKEWAPIAAMLALALAAVGRVAFLTAAIPGSGAGPQAGITPFAYLLTQGGAILRYLQMLTIPIGMTVDPDLPVLDNWVGLLCWATLVAMCVAAIQAFDRARSGFWFLAGLVLLAPTSSIFPAADLAADRRVYLPMLGFAATAAMLLEKTSMRWMLAAGAAVLAVLSVARTSVWLSEASLWEDAMRWAPDKTRPRVQLARVVPPAQAYQILIELKKNQPDDPVVASELGTMYLRENKPGEALKEFGQAVAAAPNDALALNNRGVALLMLGMVDFAKADFRRALEIRPCLFDARLNLDKAGERTAMPPECRLTVEQARQWKERN
ncbi:MAG: hypothetical protein U0Q16_22445 [Bryobacteraceae bacterium]